MVLEGFMVAEEMACIEGSAMYLIYEREEWEEREKGDRGSHQELGAIRVYTYCVLTAQHFMAEKLCWARVITIRGLFGAGPSPPHAC